MPSLVLTRRQALLGVACALALVLLAAHLLGKPRAGSGRSDSAAAGPSSTPPLTPALETTTVSPVVVVDVTGAVRRPGLYRLARGARIADAIGRAGGTTAKADSTLVNLAAPLADGEQVLVPSRAAGSGVAAAASTGPPSPTAPVDLNTATAEQLDALPGVGPVTAQKIIDYRQAHGPFTSVEGLDAIPGIGPARIENLRGLVTP